MALAKYNQNTFFCETLSILSSKIQTDTFDIADFFPLKWLEFSNSLDIRFDKNLRSV